MNWRAGAVSALALALAGIFATGCTDEIDPEPAGTVIVATPNELPGAESNAPELFINKVRPGFATKCASCHQDGRDNAPAFLPASPDDYYDVFTAAYPGPYLGASADPENSRLFVKGNDGHGGSVLWSLPEQIAITEWVKAEFEMRSVAAQVGPMLTPDLCGGNDADAACAIELISGCFDLGEFTAKNLHRVAKNNSEQGACEVCHFGGQAAFYADNDLDATFAAWTDPMKPYIRKLVMPVVTSDGAFAGIVPSKRLEYRGGELGHPGYQLNRATDVDTFVNTAIAAYEAGVGAGMPCN